ncbi:EscT/YscT/HrcT family type III secretion system export apparatus protein [Epibacterium ulvae]|uniref:EscT/YscT/HrcT family type III secretion system export apparatus protein n=1 Tax=Epibacterium ulvae TaxID=1156985 RepID=UPI0024938BC0|nr:flagellar biosynthetic protein FliR [Epibacterium ulvae]
MLTTFQNIDDLTLLLMSVVLIIARIQAFLYLSPFFGKSAMTRTVRLGVILSLSFLLAPKVYIEFQTDPEKAQVFVALIFKEILLGLLLGVLMWLPVRSLELAGVLIDTQRGSTQAMGMDVIFGVQTMPTAQLLLQLFSGFFFAVGGTKIIATVLFSSAEIWPLAETLPDLQLGAAPIFINLAGVLIFSAVSFVLPISFFMVLTDIVIAYIARSAPTLSALTFGMPIKSAVASILLIFYLDIAFPRLIEMFMDATNHLEDVLSYER